LGARRVPSVPRDASQVDLSPAEEGRRLPALALIAVPIRSSRSSGLRLARERMAPGALTFGTHLVITMPDLCSTIKDMNGDVRIEFKGAGS
jgi:hypothetical protein